MPYYRSSVSPLYGPAGSRQYEPNRRSNQSFEQAQKRVADRYFEYYAQRDPAKRADLLREYRAARRDAQYATTGREGSSARGLASPSSRDRGAGRAGDLGSAAGRTGVLDRTGAGGDRFGPAPEVPGIGSARSSAAPRSRESTPTDVLNRSRAMDRAGGVRSDRAPSVPGPRSRRPGSGAGTGTRPGSAPSSRSATRGTRPPATDAPARDRDNP